MKKKPPKSGKTRSTKGRGESSPSVRPRAKLSIAKTYSSKERTGKHDFEHLEHPADWLLLPVGWRHHPRRGCLHRGRVLSEGLGANGGGQQA
nr:MAG TPA: hypothetical protein [Caudoviricetes sp.]